MCVVIGVAKGFKTLKKLYLQFITDEHHFEQEITAQSELGADKKTGPNF